MKHFNHNALIAFLLILFLTAARPAGESKRLAVLPPDSVTVNDTLFRPTREAFLTLGDALASGSPNIRVMAGVYTGTAAIEHSVAITCDQGAVIINDGLSVSLYISAPDVTI